MYINFGCDKCEGNFNSKKLLQKHKNIIHIDEISIFKDYFFDKCIYTKEDCEFSHAEKYKNSDNTYECALCKNKFTNSEDLKDHMKLHDENNHKCSECKTCFGTLKILIII